MKSFSIGAAAALLAAWALPAPPAPQPFDEYGRPFQPPRQATGIFDWEGDFATVFLERDGFAFAGASALR
jgi:hypothetical protein